jgi:hypothetical protein
MIKKGALMQKTINNFQAAAEVDQELGDPWSDVEKS